MRNDRANLIVEKAIDSRYTWCDIVISWTKIKFCHFKAIIASRDFDRC